MTALEEEALGLIDQLDAATKSTGLSREDLMLRYVEVLGTNQATSRELLRKAVEAGDTELAEKVRGRVQHVAHQGRLIQAVARLVLLPELQAKMREAGIDRLETDIDLHPGRSN